MQTTYDRRALVKHMHWIEIGAALLVGLAALRRESRARRVARMVRTRLAVRAGTDCAPGTGARGDREAPCASPPEIRQFLIPHTYAARPQGSLCSRVRRLEARVGKR